MSAPCVRELLAVDEAVDLHALLAPLPFADQAYCRGIRNEGAARRSATARLAAKAAAERMGIAYMGIGHQTHGRPELLTGQPLGGAAGELGQAFVSLSHGPALAGALISLGSPCGLDIEPIRPKAAAIAPRYLSAAELTDLLAAGASAELASLYWCLKEAAYKRIAIKGVSLRDHLHVQAPKEGGTEVRCIYPNAPQAVWVEAHLVQGCWVGVAA